MSYWSKSNWMSLSSGIAVNSAGTGRTVVAAGAGAGVGVAGAAAGVLEAGSGALGAGADVAGGAAGAGTGGGGAATEVVAGRFAQPAATTPSSRSDLTAMWNRRVPMTPPLGLDFDARLITSNPITVAAET